MESSINTTAAVETAVLSDENSSTLSSLDDVARQLAAEKMDADLLSQLRNQPVGKPLTAIVKLGAQADLTAASQMNSRLERRHFVYQQLRDFARKNQKTVLAEVDQLSQKYGQAIAVQPYFIFNGFAVTTTADIIWELALRDDVGSITADQVVKLHTEGTPSFLTDPRFVSGAQDIPSSLDKLIPGWNIEQIRADEVWETYGVTGEGILVGSLDSGVAYQHPALVEQYAGNLGNSDFDHDYHWYDPINNLDFPYDDNGHGTHTMGTAVGGDGLGPFADDIGVAPGAKWISVKAFDAAGIGATSTIHLAFEWMLAPCPIGVAPGSSGCDPSRAPDVLNNSWGNDSGTDLEYVDDVAALRAAGIWPVFSAGNSGPAPASLGAPASFSDSFAVGAVTRTDFIANFSSRGPSHLTDEIKPEVVAPGADVISALPNTGYGQLSGTSMAAPHVTGLGALLLSVEPTLDFKTLEQLVQMTTVDLGEAGPDFDYGYGRIDAFTVVRRLHDSGNLQGTIRDAGTLTPLANVAVHLVGQGLEETAVTDANGNYSFSFLIAGDYTLSIDHYGYAPQTLTNVTVVSQQVASQDIELITLPRYIISGFVTHAITPTIPVANATITALDTPLPSVTTDSNGFYTIEVAEGDVRLEAAAFGFTTVLADRTVVADTTADFSLHPLPPILLIDDDEGRTKFYVPHVEDYYFTMLDAGGYSYDYWDIEIDGSPSFDLVRQYPAVVWFGGEFGSIKDVTDAAQAAEVMAYLDIGGKLFYISQSHTFYFGDDEPCNVPSRGGTGPCHFTEQYLGVADWIRDLKADTAVGVAGNPVGNGLGPYTMTYPPFVTDLTDTITGTVLADLAFVGLDDEPELQTNLTSYTIISPTANFQTVFMATPLEAFPPAGAADVIQRVMDWFGISGLTDGPAFAPKIQTGRAIPGETITFQVRVKNFSEFAATYTLSLANDAWPTTIWNSDQTAVLTEVGPLEPQGVAELIVTVDVPLSVRGGAEQQMTLRAESQGGTIFVNEATLYAQAKMDYYVRDSDQCNGGIHMNWVDATVGERWDLDDAGNIAQQIMLPEPFIFYNESYESLWVNTHGTLIFGEENVLDARTSSGDPPIPNPAIQDPNRAIYAAWGNFYWFPENPANPAKGVYSYHDTTNGRNWFIIEYHSYDNLLGGSDTFEVILDLDSYEISVQYLTMTHTGSAIAGIENELGSEGILYVNRDEPVENRLHDGLVIHYGIGDPPIVWEAELEPKNAIATGQPNSHVDYTLTLSNNSTLANDYTLEVAASDWEVSFWDAAFGQQIETTGPIPPCGSTQVGVRVHLPADSHYMQNTATVRARSVVNTLLTATAELVTDNAMPTFSVPSELYGSGASRETVSINVPLRNTGNITDSYQISVAGGSWLATVAPETTVAVPPNGALTAVVTVEIPPHAAAGETDLALLSVTSANYPGTDGVVNIMTEATPNIALAWDEPEQVAEGPPNWTSRYVLTVRNTGNLVDRFALATLGADWTTTIWNDSFTAQLTESDPLGPDETQRIGVQVRIPAGVAPPDQDAILAVATSILDPEAQAFALLTTAVIPPQPTAYAVELTPQAQWQQGIGGLTLSYLLEVHNIGTQTDSYVLSMNNNNWTTTLQPTMVTGVPPGEKVFVTVEVVVPESETAVYDEVAITVRRQGNTAVSDQTNLITVKTALRAVSKTYLPLIR